MDGWEAVREIKRDPRTSGTPMCALSAHVVVDGDYARSIAAGFACYLTKPIEPKDVLREIERRLAPRAGAAEYPRCPCPGASPDPQLHRH